MDLAGLAFCSRYSYPPNSLSLCGPDKQADLKWYSTQQESDQGTLEILSKFSTLFPYLNLIASENKIYDPFDKRVVEAYWLGNQLLHQIPTPKFVQHLGDTLMLKKKIKRRQLDLILGKLAMGALPYHAFHVLNIYKRTGHLDIPHTIETLDACLVNWGKVKKIFKDSIIIETSPLKFTNNNLAFGPIIERTILSQGEKDILFAKLKQGDFISYHWGYFSQKLNIRQLQNLKWYTSLSLKLANLNT